MTTKNGNTTRKQANGSNNETTKGENTMKNLNTAEMFGKLVDAIELQNKAIASLMAEVGKLKAANAEKPAPAPKKPVKGTEVQKPMKTRKIREEDAGKEIPVRTRKSASAKSQKKPEPKPTDNAKERGLKVVKKFGTQMYLRVPRESGNAEVAHINTKTKRGNCVATIHAKAEKADMGLIREFLLAYAEQLTYTKKLAQAGISKAADIAKATDAQLLKAFGC